jgi:hypothetical protein
LCVVVGYFLSSMITSPGAPSTGSKGAPLKTCGTRTYVAHVQTCDGFSLRPLKSQRDHKKTLGPLNIA